MTPEMVLTRTKKTLRGLYQFSTFKFKNLVPLTLAWLFFSSYLFLSAVEASRLLFQGKLFGMKDEPGMV